MHGALIPALSRRERERGMVWCRFADIVPASVAGRACSYRPRPPGLLAIRCLSLLPAGESGPQGRMREARTAPSPRLSPEGEGDGLVSVRRYGAGLGRRQSLLLQAPPGLLAIRCLSLLPAGEGGPQGRMRGRAACPPALTILLSRWERGWFGAGSKVSCLPRSQAEPAPTGIAEASGSACLSLLPAGEGGPPGRMREGPKCFDPAVTLVSP